MAPDNKKGYTGKLCCSLTNKKLLMEECKIEFLKHHPDFEGMTLTQDFMLTKIIEYYLYH